MRPQRWLGAILLAIGMIAFGALAQDDAAPATVQVMESDQYGPYLTDGEGRSLYLFVDTTMMAEGAETMSEGVRDAALSCTGDCLSNWPAFTAEGEVQAGENANQDLLYTAMVDDRMQVVYNGWPLYYFAGDAEPGQVNGQGRGDRWYLVSPEGSMIDSE